MTALPEGRAIVYCQGAFGTANGKTAHGLVRRTRRYEILSVVDSRHAGADAAALLDGTARGIPIFATLDEAHAAARSEGREATHFVIGLAPDGGRLPAEARVDVLRAIDLRLNVDSGLHDLLGDDPEIAARAATRGVRLRDVRRTPPRSALHFFSGKIGEVEALKIAVLGTDSAVGKRTTAWLVVDGLTRAGYPAELVGTGQTAWLQGAKHTIVLDALINDFVAGELEHAVWNAWNDTRPRAIVIEGQGSLLNPAYPGGFEILAATRPDVVLMQHAPARREYDGFPGWPLDPLPKQIQVVELISGKPVVAVAVNHEGLAPNEIAPACEAITRLTGLPAADLLRDGPDRIVDALRPWLDGTPGPRR